MPQLDKKSDDQSSKRATLPTPLANRRALLWYIPMLVLLFYVWQDSASSAKRKTLPYSEFKTLVAEGQILDCKIQEGLISGTMKRTKLDSTALATDTTSESPEETQDSEDEESIQRFLTIRVEDAKLVEELEAAGTKFVGVQPTYFPQFLLAFVLPIGLLVLFWMFLSRRMSAIGQGVMSAGKSKAKLVADQDTGVSFADVAGCDEAKYELQEVIDFLKHPNKYKRLGAKIPKGVLLLGPPGTGKTLLARAVAGEAKVPFFSLSGSEFVEMFVGVGASRVRDLFEQATKNAPCIVFIDELDAIGKQRGIHIGAVNDEREQTLNQLLVEMDGFETNVGVILLSATNRPEVLDRALLRPGRFDRQVVLDAPDLEGRNAILAVHARNKPLNEDVNLRRIAQATPGLSGADLANVMNEAALLSARRQANTISQKDIENSVEKVLAGPERKSRRLNDEEKIRVAYHEVGHALVAAHCEHADPVHKISIIPRGRAALGYTLQLPTGEKYLLTRSELIDRLKGLLGGRAAEEIKFGEVSTGAENDLERATAMARQMVCTYGMSDKVGLVHCTRRDSIFLADDNATGRVDCSEATARDIDMEVKQLLDAAYDQARQILTEHDEQLQVVAKALLDEETLDAIEFQSLLEHAECENKKTNKEKGTVPQSRAVVPTV